jgi:hypothetical protein
MGVGHDQTVILDTALFGLPRLSWHELKHSINVEYLEHNTGEDLPLAQHVTHEPPEDTPSRPAMSDPEEVPWFCAECGAPNEKWPQRLILCLKCGVTAYEPVKAPTAPPAASASIASSIITLQPLLKTLSIKQEKNVRFQCQLYIAGFVPLNDSFASLHVIRFNWRERSFQLWGGASVIDGVNDGPMRVCQYSRQCSLDIDKTNPIDHAVWRQVLEAGGDGSWEEMGSQHRFELCNNSRFSVTQIRAALHKPEAEFGVLHTGEFWSMHDERCQQRDDRRNQSQHLAFEQVQPQLSLLGYTDERIRAALKRSSSVEGCMRWLET